MNREVLERFLNQYIRLVKDDNFVIYGTITEIYDDCITFHTKGKDIILSFDRINEIVPFQGRDH